MAKTNRQIFEQEETEETEVFSVLCSLCSLLFKEFLCCAFQVIRFLGKKSRLDRSLALPVLRIATADQETSGEFAGLFLPNGGKAGGVGDIDGGYHPGRGAVSENGLAAKRHKKRSAARRNQRNLTADFADFADENSAHCFPHCHYPRHPRHPR